MLTVAPLIAATSIALAVTACVTILGIQGTLDASAVTGILGAVIGIAGGTGAAKAGAEAVKAGAEIAKNGAH